MSILDYIFGKRNNLTMFRNDEPDDAYWRKRWEDDLRDKEIVTRFLVCFGTGNYEGFCGIKQIKGHYDMTFNQARYYDADYSHEKTVPIFYQIDFDDSHSKYGYPPERCFETLPEAVAYYENNVYAFIEPLQKRVEDLKAPIRENMSNGKTRT
jgi:hypothetical protein